MADAERNLFQEGIGSDEARLRELQRRLRELEERASHNDSVWRGFRHIEISAIGARTVIDLVECVTEGFAHAFAGVDCATLACFDNGRELSRLIHAQTGAERCPGFVRLSPADLEAYFSVFDRPMLGHCTPGMQALLFPDFSKPLASVAVTPMVLQNQVIGCLAQGSTRPGHFAADRATDMLEHLAAVIALCTDNVVNHERLREDGLTDPLTGLANRRFFERRLFEEVERWYRHGSALSCLLCDIDHFKQVNDRYGHQAGDRVLQKVAQVLGGDLRGSDVLARYGGEEFVLLLPDASMTRAGEIAERLRQRVAALQPGITDGKQIDVTISIGVAGLGSELKLDQEEARNWLLQQADRALYRAKTEGRNRFRVAGS